VKQSVCALLMLAVVVSGCGNNRTGSPPEEKGGPPLASQKENLNPSRYERNEGKPRVIVFVHGVFGSSDDTWTCASNGRTWPQLLKDDARFSNSDIYLVNYSTTKLNRLMSLDDVVGNVMNRLQADAVLDHQELVFLAHSMGGLVVQRLLLRHRELAPKVKLIFFASTPQEGSQLATLGHLFVGNPQLAAMLPGDANLFLDGLHADWRDARFTIPISCVAERATTYGALVVDRDSATRYCRDVVPVAINHLDIVKPCSQNDDVYAAFWNAYHANPITQTTAATKQWSLYMEVGCDQTKRDTVTASVPLSTGEEVTGAPTAELINKDKIRHEEAKVVSSSGNTAQVLVNFDGEAKNTFGNCPGGGHATVVVTFPIRRTSALE
jgi:pimeloyl-ACP methyl ester carboxylesterase